jgi:chromosome segregation ATPase
MTTITPEQLAEAKKHLARVEQQHEVAKERLDRLEAALNQATTALGEAILEEREACAQIAESWYGYMDEAAADIAKRIRERSKNACAS